MATDTKREPRADKVAAVADIKHRLEESRAVFVTEYRGLSVSQQQRLRRALREASAEYKIYKMTLARRAASDAGLEDLLDLLNGPTGIAFVSDDPVAAAKAMKDIAAEVDAFVLKGGLLAGGMVDAEQIRAIADIEPREVQLSKMAGLLVASLQNMAGLMNTMLSGFVSMMDQLAEKKEAGAAPGGTGEADTTAQADNGDAGDDGASEDAPAESEVPEAAAESEVPEASAESGDEIASAEGAGDEEAGGEEAGGEEGGAPETGDAEAEEPEAPAEGDTEDQTEESESTEE